ncbi:hypothetical protein COOONC_13657 [Cooperia oncophora]
MKCSIGASQALALAGLSDLAWCEIQTKWHLIIIILTHFEPTQSFSVEHQLFVRVSRSPALADFTIRRGGVRPSTESHSPSFGCSAIEQLHSRKALFFP